MITNLYDENGNLLGKFEGLLPVYQGMIITIKGQDKPYEALEWTYHHDDINDASALNIVLKQQPLSKWKNIPFMNI